ncbi:MAG TPA: hypothetical protein VHZ03_39970 [Trebonia sp.]|jgi:hypothetical protein|nr:hypothetical protein [Trebonia sp.]
MAGGSDVGEALRGGLSDRQQAWDFIHRFAADWTTPLAPGDGVSGAEWRTAEQRIGFELPDALREAYLLFGRRADLTFRQDRLAPANRLSLDDSDAVVVFRTENQNCAAWGVAATDAGDADPPVYVRHYQGGGWEPFMDRVSEACVEMVLSEVLLGSWELGNMCELPGELVIAVESAYEQVALPEYPLWADRSITIRWFSAPGKLLRMDGRGPYCWLLARGQTPADLKSICATISAPWVSAHGLMAR